MKITLFIDTASNKEVTVGLTIDGERFFVEQLIDQRKAQVALPLIEKLLKEHKLTIKNITAIEVNPGPGSFTGLRVGIAIANTLGILLHIPINRKNAGELAEAIYE